MGNRAYITIQDETGHSTYYTHWNGCPDTIAPLAKALFDLNIQSASEVIRFMIEALGLKPELQNAEAINWTEENGHWKIDLVNKRLSHRAEDDQSFKSISDLAQEFDRYNNTSIRQEYRDNNRTAYWFGIQEEASKYFKARGDQ